MGILKRLSLAVFGIVCCLTGFVALIGAITVMFAGFSDMADPIGRAYMIIGTFMIGEVFLAFGIAAFLLGLRYISNREAWYKHIIDKYWTKAMTFLLINAAIGFGLAAIALLVQRISAG